jgi:hypothetical protein
LKHKLGFLRIELLIILGFLIISTSWLSLQTRAQLEGANLTRVISDRGVDVDGDEFFDYLEVAVEVNVSISGRYMVRVFGLTGEAFNSTIDVMGEMTERLDPGFHLINISLYGPKIYASATNPLNVSEIHLYFIEYYPPFDYVEDWLDSIYSVPLSNEYNYTDFDAPFSEMDLTLMIYPDGRVAMEGMLEAMHVEEPYVDLPMHGILMLAPDDSGVQCSANFTLAMTEDLMEYPFNSSSFSGNATYFDELLTIWMDGSTVFPSGLAAEFPFNATDITVEGEYDGQLITGYVNVDILPGFPLSEIILEFQGNHTYVLVNSSFTVIYGYYPEYGEFNSTVLEYLLQNFTDTYTGQGSTSIYNMTDGLLEATLLYNNTIEHNGNATVDVEVLIEGDIITAFTQLAGLPNSTASLLNATWLSVESITFLSTYSYAFDQADVQMAFTLNMSDAINGMLPLLPEVPDIQPEMVALIENLLNTTFGSITYGEVSFDYQDSILRINSSVLFEGDFQAETNFMKDLALTYLEEQPLSSQLQVLNETEFDLDNLQVTINSTLTSMELNITGVSFTPPREILNATSFTLWRFFNASTDPEEPPAQGECLAVTVKGLSNETHTVRIYRPPSVSEPDSATSSRIHWSNQSLSALKELTFQIGPLDETPPVVGVPTHTPETPNPDEAVTVSVNVTDDDSGVDRVTLSYSINDGVTWTNCTMINVGGNEYSSDIPGFSAGTHVNYKLIAYDIAGNPEVGDNEGAYYLYIVIAEYPTWTLPLLTIALLTAAMAVYLRMQKHRGHPNYNQHLSD